MPDDNEYEGLSKEEIAAIVGDDEDPIGEKTSLKEESQSKQENDNADGKEDKSNQENDKLDKSDDKQQADDKESGGKVADADNSQEKAVDADKKPDDNAKEAEGDVQGSDAGKALDDDTKDTDTQLDAAKEQKPFVPTLPEIDAAKLEQLKSDLDEAKKKFADGDIDYSELDIIKDIFNELKWKSEFTQESNLNTRETLWKWEQDRFLDDNDKFKNNVTLNAAFISVVNGIIATEDGAKLTDRQVLAKAKEQVEADLGLTQSYSASSADKSKAAEAKKQAAIAGAKKSNADRSNIAADIGGLPSAEENVDTDPFTYLDKLEGEKFQAAINKLSPEQLSKYEDRQ
jgi:hypothetical protein